MKTLRHAPGLATLVIVAFLSMIVMSPTLTSCGGGDEGGGGGDGDGGETTNTFAAFQSGTTDSSGKATFTPTKLKDASGNTLTSLEVTLTLPNGNAASGLTVYFSESDDSHYMIVGRDASNSYQTVFLTGNSQEITASSSVSVRAVNLESGEATPAGAHVVRVEKEPITIVVLTFYAVVATVTAVTAISIADKIYSVAGKIDPVRLATTGRDCFSFGTLMDHLDIAMDVVDLVCWTSSTIATAGATVMTDALYEVVMEQITDAIKDEVEQRFWDEIASSAFADFQTTLDTNICWLLHSPEAGYNKILEVRPDKTCTTAADCDSVTAIAQDFTKIDGDQDGYTPAASDCDDQDAQIYPGAFEVCDSQIDSNCDGSATACNVTTNFYMSPWPEGGGNLSPDGNGDIATLVLLTGSFIGMGSETDPDIRVVLNGDPVQEVVVNSGGYYPPGDFGFITYVQFRSGVNRIQVAVNAGSYHGSETYYYNNTSDENALSIMLSWDACPNLDLYIVEPDTGVIYSGNDTGNYGRMVYTTAGGWGPEIYKALNPASGQTYFYYVKHAGDGSCGASGHSAFYTIRVFTPYGTTTKTGNISEGETSRIYEVSF